MSEFPAGWTRAALGGLADFTNGKAFKKEEWLEAGKPIIRIQNLNNPEASFNYADDSHEDKYLVRNGDLLVSWSASLGVYYWAGQDAWLNQHIFRVHSLRGCDKGFLKYALQTSIDDFYAKAHGMGMVHITKGNFESHQVALPPLAEQTRIAQKLDELLAQVDTLKARIDGIPALLKRFRQSVLAAAVSGRLTEAWRAQSGQPNEISNCKLETIARFIDYRGKTPTKVESGIPLITAKNIRKGYISREPREYIRPEDYDSWMTRGIPNVGDVLITTEAPLGNVATIDIHEKFALAQRAICLQFTKEINSKFAAIELQSPQFQEKLLEKATGTTVKGIKASVLKKNGYRLPVARRTN